MRPNHGEFKRLRRCPCCQGKYSRHNSGTKKAGSRMARRKVRINLRKEANVR